MSKVNDNHIQCRREPRRIVVTCPSGHKIEQSLICFGYHYDQPSSSWWRGYNQAEYERVQSLIEKTTPPSPTVFRSEKSVQNLGKSELAIRGDTYPLRQILRTQYNCRYSDGRWIAPNSESATAANLAVARESLKRLNLPPCNFHIPPGGVIITGECVNAEDITYLNSVGAIWNKNWRCWTIDALPKDAAAIRQKIQFDRVKRDAMKNDAGSHRGDSFAMEFPSNSPALIFPKGTVFKLDGRLVCVEAAGFVYGKPNKRQWVRLVFTEN